MKVLIITYYWPPAGGSGVQRWLKFVKYLPQFGITPVVYVPENPNYPTTDYELLKEVKGVEVLKHSIFNPQDLLFKKNNKTGVANISKGGFLSWVRGNFFIPDAKLFWVRPSVKFLTSYLRKNHIDLIISSGPPHSLHLIGYQLKKKLNIKWIADFRDPWTSLYYAEDFNLMSFSKRKNKLLEQKVLQSADAVITVSKTIANELSHKRGSAVSVITNGYDDEVLNDMPIVLDEKFTIAHIGLLPMQSNPKLLWEVLSELSNQNLQFKNDLSIHLTGNVAQGVIDLIHENKLTQNLNLNGYVSHKKAILLQKKAQVLLLLIPKAKKSKGILTGKLFEYITSKRPILAIGDTDGDMAEVILTTKTGTVINFDDKEALKSEILKLYDLYKKESLEVSAFNIEQFHRKKLTEALSQVIKHVIQL